jgi:hypothetical protein
MTKMKLLGGVLLVLAVLFAQVGSAAAAPQTQTGTVTLNGVVTKMVPQTDGTVLVTVTAADQTTTTVRVSATVAAGLTVGQPVPQDWTVPATDVVPPEEADTHPISKLLSDFFFGDESMAADIDSWHTGDNEAEQVFGFGVIAQALWMATTGEGAEATTDAALAGEILLAKKDKSFQDFIDAHPDLFEEGVTATNWGQFKKLLHDKHENLGAAVSSEKSNKPEKLNKPNKPDKQNKPDKPHGKPTK